MSVVVEATWGGIGSVSAAFAVTSDPVSLDAASFSLSATVLGSGGGSSGNLSLLVSSGAGYSLLAGTVQTVDVAGGQMQTYNWSSDTAYDSAELVWSPVPGSTGTITGSWTVAGGTELPIVSDFAPPVGTTIGPDQPISFEVTDPNGLPFSSIVVLFSYPGGSVEAAYAGTLTPIYASNSIVTPITDGFAFSFLRSGGWPSNPTLEVFAVDTAGNANAIATYTWPLAMTPPSPSPFPPTPTPPTATQALVNGQLIQLFPTSWLPPDIRPGP